MEIARLCEKSGQTHAPNRAKGVDGIRNLLRHGIGTKCRMESSRSDVWHQSEGEMHAGAWCHTPAAITYTTASWLHTNPSDWIKKERSDCFVLFLAERKGFEPLKPYWGLHDFQSCALDQLGHLSKFAAKSPRPLNYNKTYQKSQEFFVIFLFF